MGLQQMSPRKDVAYGDVMRHLDECAAFSGDECNIWRFYRDGYGYGRAYHPNFTTRLAHRIICEMAHGPYTGNNKFVRHICGNGHNGCVNPRHLSWGTSKQNSDDKVTHGTKTFGETAGLAKLTDEKVIEIRRILARGETYKYAASMFGVCIGTIQAIKERRTWRHLP